MTEQHLHIVSFNIPYPANYGGVIDVFYRIKALSENGVKIILHAFEYGREHSRELESYCEKVYYYKRKTGFISQLSIIPYIVYSRKNKKLLLNLTQDTYPVLFEGLHCCYYLSNPALKSRIKLVRSHNIEHHYYKGLFKNTHSLLKKIYFGLETFRLKRFEKQLKTAQTILSLSTIEKTYFEKKYGKKKVAFIPLFVPAQTVGMIRKDDPSPNVLFHGDLSTPENILSATFLMKEVVPLNKSVQWVFAGLNPDFSLLKQAQKLPNVSIKANVSNEEMSQLIENAAINILYTNQVSGVKLKLLNALYNGRYCIANQALVAGSGLENLCTIISDIPEEIQKSIEECLSKKFDENEFKRRSEILNTLYNNQSNARKICELIG